VHDATYDVPTNVMDSAGVGEPISSVRWRDPNTPSITTDSGRLQLRDTRAEFGRRPALELVVGLDLLYGHEYVFLFLSLLLLLLLSLLLLLLLLRPRVSATTTADAAAAAATRPPAHYYTLRTSNAPLPSLLGTSAETPTLPASRSAAAAASWSTGGCPLPCTWRSSAPTATPT
jgi:hypothetical protein